MEGISNQLKFPPGGEKYKTNPCSNLKFTLLPTDYVLSDAVCCFLLRREGSIGGRIMNRDGRVFTKTRGAQTRLLLHPLLPMGGSLLLQVSPLLIFKKKDKDKDKDKDQRQRHRQRQKTKTNALLLPHLLQTSGISSVL